MRIYANINNSDYLVEDNCLLSDELSETLDSFSFTIGSSSADMDLKPFQKIRIHGVGIKARSFALAYAEKRQTTYDGRYAYDIQAMSQTKWLERTILPNKSYTSHIDPTRDVTTFEMIEELFNLYCPKERIADDGSATGWSYRTRFLIDSANLQAKFGSSKCPEFKWSAPTLREALSDLFATEGCIPIVKDGIFTLLDLRAEGPAARSQEGLLTETVDAQTSCESLRSSIEHAMGAKPVERTEILRLTASDGGIMTTNNCVLRVNGRINKVKKLVCVVDGLSHSIDMTGYAAWSEGGVNRWLEIDVTNGVKEKKVYNSLSSEQLSQPFTIAKSEMLAKYKQANVWYERGGDTIEGFGLGEDGFWPWQTATTAIGLALYCNGVDVVKTWGNSAAGIASWELNPYLDALFMVTYDDMSPMTQIAHRQGAGQSNQLSDSASSSFSDSSAVYSNLKSKVNRLTGKIRRRQWIGLTEDDVPALGEKVGDEIIYRRDLSFSGGHVYMFGYTAKAYVLANYFTSVKAQARDASLAYSSEALPRKEEREAFVAIDTKGREDLVSLIVGMSAIGMRRLLGGLVRWATEDSITAAGLRFKLPDDSWLPATNDAFLLDCKAVATNGAIMFDFQLPDNASVGDYTKTVSSKEINSFYPYVDGEGETKEIDVRYIHSPKVPYVISGTVKNSPFPGMILEDYSTSSSYANNMVGAGKGTDDSIEYAKPLPKMGLALLPGTQVRTSSVIDKDDAEAYGESLSVGFSSLRSDVVIGPGLTSLCPLYKDQSFAHTFYTFGLTVNQVSSWSSVSGASGADERFWLQADGSRLYTETSSPYRTFKLFDRTINAYSGERFGCVFFNTTTNEYRVYHTKVSVESPRAYAWNLDNFEAVNPETDAIYVSLTYQILLGSSSAGLNVRDQAIEVWHSPLIRYCFLKDAPGLTYSINRPVTASTEATYSEGAVHPNLKNPAYDGKIQYTETVGGAANGTLRIDITYDMTSAEKDAIKSIAIADQDNNLILGINGTPATVFANILAIPGVDVLSSDGSGQKVGEVGDPKASIIAADEAVWDANLLDA